MFSPTQILIGANVAYPASPVLRGASQSVNTGNIFVLDKNFAILTPGSTVTDTDHIYLAQIVADTVTYANPAGTSITEQKMILSNPIYGEKLKNVVSKGYVASQNKAMTVTFGTNSVIGQEYLLRIVYTDRDAENIPDGQFGVNYSYIATAADNTTVVTALAALINADANARVTASANSNVLTITAKTVSETLNSIGKYRLVNFEVASDSYYDTVGQSFLTMGIGRQLVKVGTVAVSNPLNIGQGTWREIRDIEGFNKGYRGFTNKNQYPQPDIATTWSTVKDAMYNQISIESMVDYTASNNQPAKTEIATVIALQTGSSQTTNILNALNPWLNSVGIANITF